MVRGVGAPVAGKAKLEKGVSADARCDKSAKAPTPSPAERAPVLNRARLLKCVLIMQIPFVR